MSHAQDMDTLSKRGAENASRPDHWEPLIKALASPWSPTNPNGMVILGLAESSLMHNELEEHIKKNFDIDRTRHFTYGHGSQGSPRLLNALSGYFNDRFKPLTPTTSSNFVATSGVCGAIDEATWCICNEGEGILFPLPRYTGFANDVPTRSRGKVVPVSFEREDGTLDLNDVFDPEANLRCLERAYQKSEQEGVKIKAVMISNPHNPLGKCYPPETIKAIASFCASHKLHYVSDEIYAQSVFPTNNPSATPFHSVISLDLPHPHMIHVLYGAAKDFCSNGLRLGVFYTRNEALLKAMKSIVTFGWSPYMIQDTWARILEDKSYLSWFISENQTRLAKHYDLTTSFLKSHDIPYFEGGNAALFVWVDLRKYLVGNEKDWNLLKPSNVQASEEFVKKQDLLNQRWQENGVWIGKGTGFLTEEVGWFRVVFSAEETALKVGLKRFVDVLGEMKAKGEL